MRKIRVFLNNALTDSNGDLYIPRRDRTGDHAKTHLPPGSTGTRGDPDESIAVETDGDIGAA